jgi:hypothetical protein
MEIRRPALFAASRKSAPGISSSSDAELYLPLKFGARLLRKDMGSSSLASTPELHFLIEAALNLRSRQR